MEIRLSRSIWPDPDTNEEQKTSAEVVGLYMEVICTVFMEFDPTHGVSVS